MSKGRRPAGKEWVGLVKSKGQEGFMHCEICQQKEEAEAWLSPLMREYNKLHPRLTRYRRALKLREDTKLNEYTKHVAIQRLRRQGFITPDQLARMVEILKTVALAMSEYRVIYQSHPRCCKCTICVGPGHIEENPVPHNGQVYCRDCFEREQRDNGTGVEMNVSAEKEGVTI